MIEDLVAAIADQAMHGRPFTRTGKSGLFERRETLPKAFQGFARRKLEGLTDHLLAEGYLVQALAHGSTTAKWLDIPSGPFARGEGQFQHGASQKWRLP